ncbi:hypothetical protein B0J13DRAFT_647100 [Dactylonectria estremocensis]|uniref:CHAT domain-containing protein n=1 Tax=Dactylonectria estremocensis TaxID=1079267 RepID=A0A9P9DQS3_9HYPO|nr:hypothetical protein B0J13DRAFT_647100 [Dactylonectria estremocensis]
MSSLIRITEVAYEVEASVPNPSASSTWSVELTTPTNGLRINLVHPFATVTSRSAKSEDLVKWYLEEYVDDPFEATKATQAASLILEYGQVLASQLSSHGILPHQGDLEIEVNTPYRDHGQQGDSHPEKALSRSSLHDLHWEVLEDVTIWPRDHKFRSVSVFRTIGVQSEDGSTLLNKRGATKDHHLEAQEQFNILLVVARPRVDCDIVYQLVSRHLVAITERITKDNPEVKVSINLLRPPTWKAFQDALSGRRYDLVHLDMHGVIEEIEDGVASGKLVFCKISPINPLKIRKDKRSGNEIGKVLADAKVPTVIINACESAKSQRGIFGSNIAETILSYGISSVVAMSFKVVDEAVEIFTNVFYESLLVNRLSVRESLRLSRLSLLQKKQRRATHMYSIQLADYVVPVLYCRPMAYMASSLGENGAAPSRWFESSLLQPLIDLIRRFAVADPVQSATRLPSENYNIIGRDDDILRLELILSMSKMIVLYGPGGCGKSTLLQYCRLWWKSSGWIKQSACIDLSEPHWRVASFEKIFGSIGEQLDIPADDRSEYTIISKLQNEKCLLVVDSLECLSTPVSLDLVRLAEDAEERLRQFLIRAAQGSSIIILSSRKGDDAFVTNNLACPRYPLSGLGVLAGTQLFERLAYPNQTGVPAALRHRRNIDLLRRVVILLEGNPAALNFVAPGLIRLGNDPQTLLDVLMYGVFDTEDKDRFNCRFASTIAFHLGEIECFGGQESLVFPGQIAPFWTIAPEDPRYFFWFLMLDHMKYCQEGSYAVWLTKDFQAAVENFVKHQQIGSDWAWMCYQLLDSGLLEQATLETESGKKIQCYHVHPLLTLFVRSRAERNQWPTMKFAYVRQFLLWVPISDISEKSEISRVTWDDLPQHEDYVANMKATALRYSLDEPDLEGQVRRNGWSMFDNVHHQLLNSFHRNKRPAQLLLPLVRQHLDRLYKAVEGSRPGNAPDSYQLRMIMNYSWELCNQENYAPDAANILAPALEMVSRWRAANPNAKLDDTMTMTWFQLRHVEARIAVIREGGITASELLERNLRDDADESNSMYQAIRRIQLQNLQEWATCVAEQMQLEQTTLARNPIQEMVRQHAAGNGSFMESMSNMAREHPTAWEDLTMKDVLAHVLESNQATVDKFSKLSHDILNDNIATNFADHPDLASPQGLLNFFKSTEPGSEQLARIESAFRMLAGDVPGAARALDGLHKQEAPDSTSSNGWQAIAGLHHALYDMAVPREGPRDYRRGLAHLNEYLPLLQGAPDVPARELCYTYVKFATCYSGLGMVADAGRSILAAVPLMQAAQQSECVNEMDREEFETWVFERFAEMEAMNVFMDGRSMSRTTTPSGVEGLSHVERVLLHQVVRKAKACQEQRRKLAELFGQAEEARKRLEELLKETDRSQMR